MQIQISAAVWSLVSILAGALIGVGFGLLQTKARTRNRQLEQTGQLPNGLGVMSGSMRRVAYLIVALALVQLGCPLLFTNHCEWWVSAGVVIGYGALLFNQLRQQLAKSQ